MSTWPLLDHQKHLSLQQSVAVYDIRGDICISDDVQWQWQKYTKNKNKRKDKDQNKDLMLSCKGSFGHLQCFLLSYFKSRMLSQTFWASILFKMRVYSARKEGRKVDATSRLQGRKEEEASWWKSFHESFLWETVVSVVQKFLFVFSIWLFASGQPLG